jgi:hypothetical protein
MRKIFAPLDDALIERLFQPISDLIWYRLGMGRGTTACFCLDFASLSWIVSMSRRLSDAMVAWNPTAGSQDVLLLLLGLVALISLRTLFNRARGKPGNPLRAAMQPHRAILLLMLAARLFQLHLLGLADAADIAMLAFATSALYLAACTERPPIRRSWAAIVPAV